MSNYIDADELMDSLHRVAKSLSDDGAPAAAGYVAGTIMYIANFPAADVEQVKRGKWIDDSVIIGEGSNTYRCSDCGELVTLNDGTPQENNMNFCPNCGADMREESK